MGVTSNLAGLRNFKEMHRVNFELSPWQAPPKHLSLTAYMTVLCKVQDTLRAKTKKLNLERVQDSFFEIVNSCIASQSAHLSPLDILWNLRGRIDTLDSDTIFLNFVYDEFIGIQTSISPEEFKALGDKSKWLDYFAYEWFKQIKRSFWVAYLASSPYEATFAFLSYPPPRPKPN